MRRKPSLVAVVAAPALAPAGITPGAAARSRAARARGPAGITPAAARKVWNHCDALAGIAGPTDQESSQGLSCFSYSVQLVILAKRAASNDKWRAVALA